MKLHFGIDTRLDEIRESAGRILLNTCWGIGEFFKAFPFILLGWFQYSTQERLAKGSKDFRDVMGGKRLSDGSRIRQQ